MGNVWTLRKFFSASSTVAAGGSPNSVAATFLSIHDNWATCRDVSQTSEHPLVLALNVDNCQKGLLAKVRGLGSLVQAGCDSHGPDLGQRGSRNTCVSFWCCNNRYGRSKSGTRAALTLRGSQLQGHFSRLWRSSLFLNCTIHHSYV